jgi:AcrR family transcriptional regulator
MKVDAPSPRRRVHRLSREKRIADIMETAREVFCAKGYNEAVISEIAEKIGIVEGTIYRYFPSKRDLLIEVAEDWYEQMLADYDEQLKGITGTRNRLRFLIWRHLNVIHDDQAMCRLVMGELRVGPEYRDTSVFELNRQYTKRTLAIVKEAIATGEFRADAPLQMVRDMIYGGIEHHTWAFLRGEGDFSPDQAADEIVDVIYRGLANTESTSGDAGVNPQALTRLENVARRLERIAENADSKKSDDRNHKQS